MLRDVSHKFLRARVQWARRQLDKATESKDREYRQMVLDDLRRDVCFETPVKEERERTIESLRRFGKRLGTVLERTPRYMRFLAHEAEKRRKKAKKGRRRARKAEKIAQEADDEAVIESFLHRDPAWIEQVLDAPVNIEEAKKALHRFHGRCKSSSGSPGGIQRAFVSHLDQIMQVVKERMIGRLLGSVPSEPVLQFIRTLSPIALDIAERIRSDVIDNLETSVRLLCMRNLDKYAAASDIEAFCLDQGSVFAMTIASLVEESSWSASLFSHPSHSVKLLTAKVQPLGTCCLLGALPGMRETVKKIGCVALVYRRSEAGSSSDISATPPVLAVLKDGSVLLVNAVLWDRGGVSVQDHALAAGVPKGCVRRDIR